MSGRLEPGPGGLHPFPPTDQWNWTQHNPFNAVCESNRRSVCVVDGILYLAAFRARLHSESGTSDAPQSAWTSFARALLGSNEFLYLD